jgi:hypothetical protein
MIDWLAAGFSDGRIPLLIFVLVLFEAALLVLLWRHRGVGIAPRAILGNLASGAFLMLAVAAALRDAPWWSVAALLSLSLIAHLFDLALRWRG